MPPNSGAALFAHMRRVMMTMKKETKKVQTKRAAELRKIGRQRLAMFKKAKREQIQNVINAFNRFRIGCANVPDYSFQRMESIAAQLATLKADTKKEAGWGES